MPIASVAAVQMLGVDRDTGHLGPVDDEETTDVLPDGLEFQADGLICVDQWG